MNFIVKNKQWTLLAFLLIAYGIIGYLHTDKSWINSFLQFGAVFLSIVFYLILTTENNKSIAANTERHIQAIEKNTEKQIQAIANNTKEQINISLASTEKQIQAVADNTEKQIQSITENTDRQINELRKVTSEEIEAMRESTDRQIEHYRQETEKLVDQLKNNSELLAGILQRHLEDAINKTQLELNSAQTRYRNIEGFKILRTRAEKESQLAAQGNIVQRIGNKLEHFKNQYYKVIDFIKTIKSEAKEIY